MIATAQMSTEKARCLVDDDECPPQFGEQDDFTGDALAALRELDQRGPDNIALMLRFGELVASAKRSLGHGRFTEWCRDALRRSPTWVSAHRRLFQARGNLAEARTWAADTGHRWAHCYSVERLLGVIRDWKKATLQAGHSARRGRRTPKRTGINIQLAEIAAHLGRLLDDVEHEFETICTEVSIEPSSDRGSMAKHCARLRELRESCGALQISEMPVAAFQASGNDAPGAGPPN